MHLVLIQTCCTVLNGAGNGHGWNRTILWGNCIVVDVDFWLQPVVQR
jgi:hypothetical protein